MIPAQATGVIHRINRVAYRRNMNPPSEVLVIGAGVSGLTTAVTLAEEGYRVRVISREDPQETTSCAAGAIWGPYLLEAPIELRWSAETFDEFERLCTVGTPGVRMVHGIEASHEKVDTPGWTDTLADFTLREPGELPAGYLGGWSYTAPIIDMPVYLRYLVERLRRTGVTIKKRTVGSLAEIVSEVSMVINCTGIGAAALTGDTSLVPTRGELLVVENPGIKEFFAEYDDSPDSTYFLPHGSHLILGGSFDPGRPNREPDSRVAKAILARCAAVEPRLAGAVVLEHRVGLRPIRPLVRLETQRLGRGAVVHNYGHGGAGVTMSWGCARAVLAEVRAL